jgi:carotenoid 1,2-hydratase
MQLLTGKRHDVCHGLRGPGAYEWWYADALSDDGEWGVVLILFRGMPMSPTYLANPTKPEGGYALSVYHRGVRIGFAFGSEDATNGVVNEDRCDVELGPHHARSLAPTDGAYSMAIHAPGDGRWRAVHAEIVMHDGWAAPSDEAFTADHGWVLAAPRGKASVRIRLGEGERTIVDHRFSAWAYHDHNMGVRAMAADFRDWYWGRVHAEDRSFVYLATPRATVPFHWVGEVDTDGVVHAWRDVAIRYERPFVSFMGLFHHRRIILYGVDRHGARRTLECLNERACEDGPFYQRYVSRWSVDGVSVGAGMSEYMDVRRLSAPWIRPFLRLPFVRHGAALGS